MPKAVPTYRPPGQPDPVRVYESEADRKAYNAFLQSRPWRKLRSLFIQQHPLCSICEAEGKVTAAEIIHHIVSTRDDPSRRLDWDNLAAYCSPCHTRHHKAKH